MTTPCAAAIKVDSFIRAVRSAEAIDAQHPLDDDEAQTRLSDANDKAVYDEESHVVYAAFVVDCVNEAAVYNPPSFDDSLSVDDKVRCCWLYRV